MTLFLLKKIIKGEFYLWVIILISLFFILLLKSKKKKKYVDSEII